MFALVLVARRSSALRSCAIARFPASVFLGSCFSGAFTEVAPADAELLEALVPESPPKSEQAPTPTSAKSSSAIRAAKIFEEGGFFCGVRLRGVVMAIASFYTTPPFYRIYTKACGSFPAANPRCSSSPASSPPLRAIANAIASTFCPFATFSCARVAGKMQRCAGRRG